MVRSAPLSTATRVGALLPSQHQFRYAISHHIPPIKNSWCEFLRRKKAKRVGTEDGCSAGESRSPARIGELLGVWNCTSRHTHCDWNQRIRCNPDLNFQISNPKLQCTLLTSRRSARSQAPRAHIPLTQNFPTTIYILPVPYIKPVVARERNRTLWNGSHLRAIPLDSSTLSDDFRMGISTKSHSRHPG